MMEPASNKTEGSGPQPTRWSLVARLQDTDEEARMRALNSLLLTYLPVLEWYLGRHTGLDPHRKEDMVQGFIASKVIRQQILTRANRSRGRFRTFLLNAFQNYIRDELRRSAAARRAPPGGPPVPLDQAAEVAGNYDMARQLHQAWVRQVVATAITAMEEDCSANDRNDVWQVFHLRLLNPMLSGSAPQPYGQLVKDLGLQSPSQASNLLITAKRMFSRHLRAVVQETVADPAQAEDELQELRKCL